MLNFQQKQLFGKVCFFYSELLGVTNLRLTLGHCLVNAMTFIKQYIVKLLRLSFNEL